MVAVRNPGKPPLPCLAALQSIANYTPGKIMRFRIERRDDQVIMSITNLPGATHTFKSSDYPGLFDPDKSYLFFGNTTEGTTFDDLKAAS